MNNNFRKRLIEVRNTYGLSGYAFAKKLNIPQPTYLRYESGEQKPSGKLIESLVLICNVNAYWLYSGEGEMFFNPDTNSGVRRNDVTVFEKSESFGKRLSALQAKHNLLDREMAKLLDISERHYISVVTGKKEADISILNRIKQNFSVTIDYLLYGN
ncbi:helix-turn-helix transcriptional regulator [bacterium]|nr:helix-turn-helix transcriptional regulator [bacterium]